MSRPRSRRVVFLQIKPLEELPSLEIPGASFGVQDADRVDSESAPRRNVSGEKTNREQKQGRSRDVDGIARLDAKELRSDVACQSQQRETHLPDHQRFSNTCMTTPAEDVTGF